VKSSVSPYFLKKNSGWIILIYVIFLGCSSEVKNPSLTMDSADIVHAMVQIATINGVLEVSDASLQDSLFQHYKTEMEHLTQKEYEEVMYNLRVLETMPDTLILLQTQALDTLRKLQNKLVYKRDVD
jgi:hypothetical protein